MLRAELGRIEGDVKSSKLRAEMGEGLASAVNERLRELERELPSRRQWAETGKADAQRELTHGKVRVYEINDAFFPDVVCRLSAVSQEDWNRALQELTGASVLPVRPHGSDLWLLAARVDGYNQEVWNHLRSRHGADLLDRVEARAKRFAEPPGIWRQTLEGTQPFFPFIAALGALLLLTRLVELRKRRERIPSAI